MAALLSRACSSPGLSLSISTGSVYSATLKVPDPRLEVLIDADRKAGLGTASPDGCLPAECETGEFKSKDFALPCHKIYLPTL